ncbi:IclR family transcriptional regulator [Paraburkholderia xenovorans]|uniref:IclR family transcriptional regulator n=1 Tax=Paraburkholderia xenovorans TaxID=36873 RepID=UPI0015597A8A|nr:IclR family transcriptional regulator [Paraburkholderia xenovorans]NPT36432.1 helix-turn-helix domain-containing protein [Paraburkholderia xenovorans]
MNNKKIESKRDTESDQTRGTSSSSLERLISVLDVIEESPTGLTFDQMLEVLQLTRSTLYRYVKILSEAGLITSLPDLGYTLGPRVAELDYKMRAQDPLISAARPVMAELSRSVGGVALLCRRYRDKVLCVHQEGSSATFRSAYERGRDLPLFRGAASRIILAQLHMRVVSRLYHKRPQEFAASGLGNTLAEVKASLAQIRHAGWCAIEGEITAGVTGIAAAVFDNQNLVVGSLSITIGKVAMKEEDIGRIAEHVKFCASIVSNAIAAHK